MSQHGQYPQEKRSAVCCKGMLDSSSHGSCTTRLVKVGGKTAVYQAMDMTRRKHLHVLMPQQHSMDGKCGNQTEAFSHGPSCCYQSGSTSVPQMTVRLCAEEQTLDQRENHAPDTKQTTATAELHKLMGMKEYSGQKPSVERESYSSMWPFELDPVRGWETADRRGQETREAERSSRQGGAADTDNSMQRVIVGRRN